MSEPIKLEPIEDLRLTLRTLFDIYEPPPVFVQASIKFWILQTYGGYTYCKSQNFNCNCKEMIYIECTCSPLTNTQAKLLVRKDDFTVTDFLSLINSYNLKLDNTLKSAVQLRDGKFILNSLPRFYTVIGCTTQRQEYNWPVDIDKCDFHAFYVQFAAANGMQIRFKHEDNSLFHAISRCVSAETTKISDATTTTAVTPTVASVITPAINTVALGSIAIGATANYGINITRGIGAATVSADTPTVSADTPTAPNLKDVQSAITERYYVIISLNSHLTCLDELIAKPNLYKLKWLCTITSNITQYTPKDGSLEDCATYAAKVLLSLSSGGLMNKINDYIVNKIRNKDDHAFRMVLSKHFGISASEGVFEGLVCNILDDTYSKFVSKNRLDTPRIYDQESMLGTVDTLVASTNLTLGQAHAKYYGITAPDDSTNISIAASILKMLYANTGNKLLYNYMVNRLEHVISRDKQSIELIAATFDLDVPKDADIGAFAGCVMTLMDLPK